MMSINTQFTEENWERAERNWAAWWAGELDRALVMIEGLALPPGVARQTIPDLNHDTEFSTSGFQLHIPVDEVLDEFQAGLEAKRFYQDYFPKWWPNFGPGVIAAFLGSETRPVADTVWFEPVEGEIGDLHLAFSPGHFLWQRVKEMTRRAVERWRDQVCVGITDLGGNLDILASLRGTRRLLMEVIDAPAEVERLVGEIDAVWMHCYDELTHIIRQAGRGTSPWAAIWSLRRCYMLQCDFSFMISPQMFERFALPSLAAACEALDHSFYHLDGPGQVRHLDMLLALKRLDGIQWVPGAGAPQAEEWMPLLKRIRDAGKLCQIYVSPDGARKIVREMGGRGLAMYIRPVDRQGTDIPERMTEEEVRQFLRVLSEEDVGGAEYSLA
jgi:5-methyltetrahydrofolate--homocysteine methyltransferase